MPPVDELILLLCENCEKLFLHDLQDLAFCMSVVYVLYNIYIIRVSKCVTVNHSFYSNDGHYLQGSKIKI